MIVPSTRLILAALVAILPISAVLTLMPDFAAGAILAALGCIIVCALDGFLGTRRLRALAADAPPAVKLTQRRPGAVPIALTNHSAKPVTAWVAVGMPEGISSDELVQTAVVAPGKSTINWACTGLIRGDHRLSDVHLQIGSPLGLWHVRTDHSIACELRVYPDLRDRATAAVFQRTALTGTRIQRQVGKGREFDRLRQYLPGDSYEDIYWKGTAKRGAPVVKLHHLEHAQQVYVALDCSRLSALENVLDGYVEAALHLALSAERQGDRFGVVVFSDRVHAVVQARRGGAHFRICRDAIYNVKPRRVNPDFGDIFAAFKTSSLADR